MTNPMFRIYSFIYEKFLLAQGSVVLYYHTGTFYTLFKNENERKKTKPVPIPLPRPSRNFPDVKTRNKFFFHNWTSEIIPFIRFGEQMDGA